MLTAEIELATGAEHRTTERRAFDTFVGLREMGFHKRSARILDISTEGFRIESSSRLTQHAAVWLTLPGLAPQLARVMWVSNWIAGCRFLTPLHPAVLDSVLRAQR